MCFLHFVAGCVLETHEQTNKETKTRKNKLRCFRSVLVCTTVPAFRLSFGLFMSRNRGKPCAPSVLRFLWLALGLVGIFSPLVSLTFRGSLILPTKRAPRVSCTNRFCGLACFRSAFRLPSFRKCFRAGIPLPVSCAPILASGLAASRARFPVFLSGVPLVAVVVLLFVSVSAFLRRF